VRGGPRLLAAQLVAEARELLVELLDLLVEAVFLFVQGGGCFEREKEGF
jgi:hypothetical protein